jgi:hypothetical protein
MAHIGPLAGEHTCGVVMVAVNGIRIELSEDDRADSRQRAALRLKAFPGEARRPGAEERMEANAEAELAVAAWLRQHKVPFSLADGLGGNIHIKRVAPNTPPFRVDVRGWTPKPGSATVVDEALARVDGDFDGVIVCSRTAPSTSSTVYVVELLVTRAGRTLGALVVEELMRVRAVPMVVTTAAAAIRRR